MLAPLDKLLLIKSTLSFPMVCWPRLCKPWFVMAAPVLTPVCTCDTTVLVRPVAVALRCEKKSVLPLGGLSGLMVEESGEDTGCWVSTGAS